VDTVGTHPRAAASDSSFLCRRRQGQRPPARIRHPRRSPPTRHKTMMRVGERERAQACSLPSAIRRARARSAKSWAVNRQCPLRTTRTEQAQCVGVPGQRTRRRPSTSAWRPLWPRLWCACARSAHGVATWGVSRGAAHCSA
jgi:hypothetical protein